MNPKLLTAVAVATGAFALFVGIWGVVSPGDLQTAEELQESIRWIGAGIASAAISAVSAALLYVTRRTPQ